MTIIARTESTVAPASLLVALELNQRTWKLGFTVGLGQRPRIGSIAAGTVDCLMDEIALAKSRLDLAADAPVVTCFEAGRDGFWCIGT